MNSLVKKNGIFYGVVIGAIAVLTGAIIYAVDLNLFLNKYIGGISILVYIAIGVMAVVKTKKEMGKLITFREAFATYFLAAAVGLLISVLFNILLFNVIDPDAKETLRDISARFNIEMMEGWGQKLTDKQIDDIYATDNFAPGAQFIGLGFSLVMSAIAALIVALIFKNKSEHPE